MHTYMKTFKHTYKHTHIHTCIHTYRVFAWYQEKTAAQEGAVKKEREKVPVCAFPRRADMHTYIFTRERECVRERKREREREKERVAYVYTQCVCVYIYMHVCVCNILCTHTYVCIQACAYILWNILAGYLAQMKPPTEAHGHISPHTHIHIDRHLSSGMAHSGFEV